jgi:hypothetical protein
MQGSTVLSRALFFYDAFAMRAFPEKYFNDRQVTAAAATAMRRLRRRW